MTRRRRRRRSGWTHLMMLASVLTVRRIRERAGNTTSSVVCSSGEPYTIWQLSRHLLADHMASIDGVGFLHALTPLTHPHTHPSHIPSHTPHLPSHFLCTPSHPHTSSHPHTPLTPLTHPSHFPCTHSHHPYSWADPLFWLGLRRSLEQSDLYAHPSEVDSEKLLKRFNR